MRGNDTRIKSCHSEPACGRQEARGDEESYNLLIFEGLRFLAKLEMTATQSFENTYNCTNLIISCIFQCY